MERCWWALACALTVVTLQASPAEARGGCGASEYAYAGLQARMPIRGVAATLRAVSTPRVYRGHVAGWIGVGGAGAGPNHTDEWLQVGLSAFGEDTASRIYYEVARPGSEPRYHELASRVAAGARRRVAVLELANRPSWWRVWVDGRPGSAPVYLPGSHGRWGAQMFAESWNGGTGVCNRYSYAFEDVATAALRRSLSPFAGGEILEDPGYDVLRSPGGFFARSR